MIEKNFIFLLKSNNHMGAYSRVESNNPHGGLFEGGGLFHINYFRVGAYSKVGAYSRAYGSIRQHLPNIERGFSLPFVSSYVPFQNDELCKGSLKTIRKTDNCVHMPRQLRMNFTRNHFGFDIFA